MSHPEIAIQGGPRPQRQDGRNLCWHVSDPSEEHLHRGAFRVKCWDCHESVPPQRKEKLLVHLLVPLVVVDSSLLILAGGVLSDE